MLLLRRLAIYLGTLFLLPAYALAAGTTGASFLDIPVGAGPASLGGAYSALATDAFAPTYNPAALAFTPSTQFSGMHLAYIDSINYEYASFVHPFADHKQGLGFSIQYLNSGEITSTNLAGQTVGSYSGYYANYSVAYGHHWGEHFSLGLSGKVITAKIADVSASAFGFDFGSYYQASDRLALSAVLTNVGTSIKFLDQADPLPLAFKLGAGYSISNFMRFSLEGIAKRDAPWAVRMGTEWSPWHVFALRVGYRTDTLKELSPLAGLTTGFGIRLWGQELDYAWLPLGDLGNTQYVSLVLRFGARDDDSSMIHFERPKVRTGRGTQVTQPEEDQLMELLDQDNKNHVAKKLPIQ